MPRSTSRVGVASGDPLFKKNAAVADGQKSIKLNNPVGALAADADFYTWGLSDAKDVPKSIVDTGYDLRAAGVQSFPDGTDQFLVFAINNHHRWSNAAANEYDVVIDTDGDGAADWVVFSADGGLVTAGDANGISQVFEFEIATGKTFASGFNAQAPTDSSTILLPVYASDLGITGQFHYRVQSFSSVNSGSDVMPGTATYNPWSQALSNGQYVSVPRNGSVTVPVDVNAVEVAAQKPLGVMAVVMDNASGAGEAVLVKIK